MAATKTQRKTAARAKATPRRAAASRSKTATARAKATPRRAAASRSKTAVERTTELSQELAQSIEDGQRAAIEAVRKFVDTVDHALPALPHGEGPSRRQEIIDSALQMADRLVHTQYDFLRKVVNSAGESLSESGRTK